MELTLCPRLEGLNTGRVQRSPTATLCPAASPAPSDCSCPESWNIPPACRDSVLEGASCASDLGLHPLRTGHALAVRAVHTGCPLRALGQVPGQLWAWGPRFWLGSRSWSQLCFLLQKAVPTLASGSPSAPWSVGLPPGLPVNILKLIGKGSRCLTFPGQAGQVVGCGRGQPRPLGSSWDPSPLRFWPLQPQERVDQAPAEASVGISGGATQRAPGMACEQGCRQERTEHRAGERWVSCLPLEQPAGLRIGWLCPLQLHTRCAEPPWDALAQ